MANQRMIRVTPTISAASAYQAADQVGGIQTLTNAVANDDDKAVKLSSLVVVDVDSEGAALDIHFFSALPTVVSVDNGALDIADAQMSSKYIGTVQVATGDFLTVAGCKVATKKDINLDLVSTDTDTEGNKSNKIYVVVSTPGTPTYTTVSDLIFSYVLES